MVMRTFVGLTGIEVAASSANVMLIARLHLLNALNLVSFVLEIDVQTLAFLVALDVLFRRGYSAHVAGQWLVRVLVGDSSPGRIAVAG